MERDGKEINKKINVIWISSFKNIYATKVLVGMGTYKLSVWETCARENKRGRIPREKNSNAWCLCSDGTLLINLVNDNTKERQSKILGLQTDDQEKIRHSASNMVEVEKIDVVRNTTTRLSYQNVPPASVHSATTACTAHMATQGNACSCEQVRSSDIND